MMSINKGDRAGPACMQSFKEGPSFLADRGIEYYPQFCSLFVCPNDFSVRQIMDFLGCFIWVDCLNDTSFLLITNNFVILLENLWRFSQPSQGGAQRNLVHFRLWLSGRVGCLSFHGRDTSYRPSVILIFSRNC